MIWIHRNFPRGFDDISKAEMLASGLTQVSERLFTGDHFDLSNSAYAGFTVEEISRGKSAEEAIKNICIDIPSPYRVEKLQGSKRMGSLTYAFLAEDHVGGDIRAADPAAIILVFTPDGTCWVTGFLREKEDSVVEKLGEITERTCVSLAAQAALALVNLAPDEPIVDPCCGTGLIPLAALLRGKETYTADNNYKMLRMARLNRDLLDLDIEMPHKEAMEPWIENCCLVTDFPAERSWMSNTKDVSLELFKAWIPYIKSFCVILPNRLMENLPENIQINKRINFTADRVIIIGTPHKLLTKQLFPVN
ncbi:MAG: hypothetical protein JEY91_19890 [Spirochaetaceae bacterium]|nr:hypothetical protein [Spirochaetaceae bacterium]